jgi:hypothetical protein
MRELNAVEVQSVSGAGVWWDIYRDLKMIAGDLPDFYRTLIGSTTEMICIATDDC